MSKFQFARRTDGKVQHTSQLASVLDAANPSNETWLFVSPHDDDIVLGAGLWQMAALEAGVDIHLLVVTDGHMGYCAMEKKDHIAAIRQREVYDSCELLGMKRDRVHFMGFPDGGLYQMQGRRPARDGEPHIAGYTGLLNALTYQLRRIRPQRVFVPAATDLHPDHQITHNELMICLFHASGQIWPELGNPLDVPALYELAVYCDFAAPPNLQITADDATFDNKLDAIRAFKSQLQIEQLINKVAAAGPREYLHEVTFNFYDPSAYRGLFE